MSKSLHINGFSWKAVLFSERTILLKLVENEELSIIHEVASRFEKAHLKGVLEIIPAYQSIALVYVHPIKNLDLEISRINEQIPIEPSETKDPVLHRIPVCYELGIDWKEVIGHTGMNRAAIIQKHLQGEYTVAMMGFTPGFIYLEGMNEEISVPRRSSPRTKIPTGAVGIGGTQTGFYALESPGGWQIIGRTPKIYFDVTMKPPVPFKLGDKVKFEQITESDFDRFIKGERV